MRHADRTSIARTPVTIVIPVWNAVETTKDCLTALRGTLGPSDQVVVVDNGSQDATPAVLAGLPWIDVITMEQNQGFAGGCNAGARAAHHPLVVFLNNDTLPTPEWIEGLVEPFTDPGIGAAGPMSNFVSGPQLYKDDSYDPHSIADIARHAAELRDRSRGQIQEVQRLVGFCFAVRTAAFGELGGFDESYGLGGYEDDDLCHRLRFAGWRLVIVQDTFMHHIGHQTFDENKVDRLALEESNAQKLTRKLESGAPVSFLVLCGTEPLAAVATLVGIEQTMGHVPFEVVLLIADEAAMADVLAGVRGVVVMNVTDLPEEEAWQLGSHKATGLRRAMVRAGEAVDVPTLQFLLNEHPLEAVPTHVGVPVPPQVASPVTPASSTPQSTLAGADAGVTVDTVTPRAAADTRVMYLDLMQKCLLNTIYEDPSQDPWSDKRFDAAKRAGGLDWPSVAHTMIGEKRMSNLRRCVEAVIADAVPGDLIETGVWRGGACIYMRAILKAHGVTDRRVFVADSFEGLPPPDPAKYPADAGDQHHTYAPLAVSREQVQANFAKYDLLDEQVLFLKGWFKDTLQDAPIERLAVLRLDGDMYESTMDALTAVYHKVSPGGFIIVDDYALAGCKRAILDYRAQHGIKDAMMTIDSMSVYWRKS